MSVDQSMIVKALQSMKPRAVDAWMRSNPDLVKKFIWQAQNFPCFALPNADRPVVICGFVHEFGVCEAWMITGEGFEKHAHHVLPMQRALCSSMYKALDLHRMEISVEAGRVDAEGWAEKLGFSFETVLQRRGPRGEDLSIYLWPDERKKSWAASLKQ